MPLPQHTVFVTNYLPFPLVLGRDFIRKYSVEFDNESTFATCRLKNEEIKLGRW